MIKNWWCMINGSRLRRQGLGFEWEGLTTLSFTLAFGGIPILRFDASYIHCEIHVHDWLKNYLLPITCVTKVGSRESASFSQPITDVHVSMYFISRNVTKRQRVNKSGRRLPFKVQTGTWEGL